MKKKAINLKRNWTFIIKPFFFPVLTFLLGIAISLLSFIFFVGQIPSNFIDNRTISAVTGNLNNDYQYKVITKALKPEINPSILVWANDKDLGNFCYDKGKIDKKPIIRVYKKSDFSILSLIPYFKQEYTLNSSLEISVPKNNDTKEADLITDFWISNVYIEDLNGDGSDEIVVKGYSFICGSGGSSYLLVLKDNGSSLDLIATLPAVGYQASDQVKQITEKSNITLNKGVDREILILSSDSFLEFQDLDNDGIKELVLGYPEWDIENECHLCAHTWLIGVYKFSGKEFVIDNKWNNGLLYVTPEKITLADGLGYPNIERNIPFPLFGMYYFDCSYCDPFHNSTRKKSTILKIVEEKYN